MIVVTGASGQLGRLVVEALLKKVAAENVVAAVRNPAKIGDLAARGVQVREADYTKPATLDAAFQGADKLLLISSSEVGQRAAQHRNIIDAAKRARVGLVAYTSILRADTSPLHMLASEHRETETMLKASGLPHVLLRNGWYTENYIASIPVALQHGLIMGCAGDGKISSAARADYAAAAVVALTADDQAGKVHELAGDEAYTLSEFAAEITRQSGKTVAYKNMTEAEFKQVLLGAGLPEPIAAMLADAEAGTAKGGLFDDGHQLSRLIGRPTTPLATLIGTAIRR